jgi:thymidylate kinase
MALSRISSRSQGNWTDEEVDKIGAMEHNYNRLLNATWCPYPLTKIKKWFVVNGMRPQVEVVHDIEVIIKQILNIERGEKLEKKM